MAAIPVATWVFGAVGIAALLRGIWNPTRALVDDGKLSACPGGKACSPVVQLHVKGGGAAYSAASGTVVSVGPDWVQIAADDEPVVLGYFGVVPDVLVGQGVGRGQPLGAVALGVLGFGVWVVSDAGMGPIEPTSWLASRGFQLASSMGSGLPGDPSQWCAGGNKIVVPADVHNVCKLGMPAQPDFTLFPVSISQG